MPKINVYLSEELAGAVREAAIPVSSVCQRAVADAVAAADGLLLAGSDTAVTGAGGLSRFSRRARTAVEQASAASAHPTSVDVLRGIVAEGHNLAIGVLRALGIEPDDLLAELRGRSGQGGARADDLTEVVKRSADQAVALGHNYLGCEHLLLGLAAGADGEVVADTLRAMDIDASRGQQAVSMMLAGHAYARDHSLQAGLSTSIRSALEEIRTRLSRLESR